MQKLHANKVMKGKVGKQRICHNTKSICFNKCEKSNFRSITYN